MRRPCLTALSALLVIGLVAPAVAQQNPNVRPADIEWLEENVDAYLEKVPSSSGPGLPTTLVGRCNENNLALMEAFFDGRDDMFKLSLDRQVENLRACIDNLNHSRSGLMEFLAQYDD